MELYKEKVSVIIPVYNGANFIVEAIECAFEQTHKNLEIIVIDDCSTDNTLSELSSIESSIILLKLQYNQGASAARNMGLKHATGRFIAFLDADDLWSPYFIETMLTGLSTSTEHEFIYCLHSQIEMGSVSELSITKPESCQPSTLSLLNVFQNPYMATSAMLFERNMLEYVSAFDCNLKTAEDIDFVLRVAEFKPILRLEKVLVEVRVRMGSLGQAVASYKDNIDVIDEFLTRNPSFTLNHGKEITEIYEEIYYCWIRELLYRRSFNEFYKQSVSAIKTSPSVRIFRLMIKSAPLLILSVFNKK